MEVKWRSRKTEYEQYIKRRKEIVAELKKRAKPEKLTLAEIEKMIRTNQTL